MLLDDGQEFENGAGRSLLPGFRKLSLDNLADAASRHLMVLTHSSASLSLLFGAGILDECNTSVLIGSKFRGDANELHVVQQINQVHRGLTDKHKRRHVLPGP